MTVIHSNNAPAAIGPYSQAISVNGFVFTSGQLPIDPASGNIAAGGIAEQTERICKNIAAVLEEAGTSPANAVKTLCFLADMGDFAAFNEVYARYFPNCPARSCVAVKALPKGALAEVECIAWVPEHS